MPDPHPNILLITTDQQRGDCLSLDPHGPYAGGRFTSDHGMLGDHNLFRKTWPTAMEVS